MKAKVLKELLQQVDDNAEIRVIDDITNRYFTIEGCWLRKDTIQEAKANSVDIIIKL